MDIYMKILNGEQKRFPQYTWEFTDDSLDYFKRCTRYYVLNVRKLDRESFLALINEIGPKELFKKARLLAPFYQYFKGKSHHDALIFMFPEWDIKAWELAAVSRGFWNLERIYEYMVWVADKNSLDRESIIEQVKSSGFAKKHNRVISTYYSLTSKSSKGTPNQLYELFNQSFPHYNFKKWEFNNTQLNDEESREAVVWLIQEKLRWDLNYTVHNITIKHFNDNGLRTVIQKKYMNSLYKALKDAFPNYDWRLLSGVHLRTIQGLDVV